MKLLAGLALMGALEGCAAFQPTRIPLPNNQDLRCKRVWLTREGLIEASGCDTVPPPQPPAEPPPEPEPIPAPGPAKPPPPVQTPLYLSERFHSWVITILTIETPDKTLDKCAYEITRQLQELLSKAGCQIGYTKDFAEMKLVFCEGQERIDCLARAGKSLGADIIIYGHLNPARAGSADSATLNLNLVDVEGQRLEDHLDAFPIDCQSQQSIEAGTNAAIRVLLK